MSKNKIIALVLSIIFLYEFCTFAWTMHEYYNSIKKYELSTLSFSISFYLNPLLYIFNLIALLQFVTSKFKRATLLKILLMYYTFSSFIFFPIWTINTFLIGNPHQSTILETLFFMRYGLSFVITIVNALALHYLLLSMKPQLISLADGNQTFDEVRKWQRFFHRIIDLSVIALIIYPSFSYIFEFLERFINSSKFLSATIGKVIEADQTHYILTYSIITAYYLVSEGIFNTSIGKIILGNVVVNNIAERPRVSQRIGRNFARILPFDACSFLFISRGWHDSLSQTYVVKADKTVNNIGLD